ncbi:MAG: glycosyltransferase family 9 protein [Candidatus Aminicenantes bacterium]|nr:glycosyltransferase family 9 protein [Candidatus Aminicenantes bacterium]
MTPSKILIVRLRRIGDVVMTTPALTLLKEHFPKARLTYLVEEPYRRLVEGHPALDRVIAIPPQQRFKDFVRLVREVRQERYDVLLDLHGGPRASWITFWSRAKIKAGYAIEGKGFLYDIRVSRRGEKGPIHSVQNHAALVRALGAEFEDTEIPALSLPAPKPDEVERVRAILHHHCHPERSEESHIKCHCEPLGVAIRLEESSRVFRGISSPCATSRHPERIEGSDSKSRPESFEGSHPSTPRQNEILRFTQDDNEGVKQVKLVVLHIGAGNRFRDWGAKNIAALTELLSRVPNVKIALIGASADQKVQAEILASAGGSVIPLAGRLNLIEIRELISRAALFVGPDSGPMHIAASTPTPIVAYFGPTLPAHFAPWRPQGSKVVILEKNLACRPCKQRECLTNDFRCLLTITPAEVFAACRPFLT